MSIRCGHCKNTHPTVADVRACATTPARRPADFACGWLIHRRAGGTWIDGEWYDYEAADVECGADAWADDTGWTCAAGHSHVTAQARHEQGWDYAADQGEADALAKRGTEPRDMQGRAWQ